MLISEHVPTACARVDSLRAHGYRKEALALAVSVVRSIKHWQKRRLRDFSCKLKRFLIFFSNILWLFSEEIIILILGSHAPDGWIGHPLDPVNCLFDTMASASEIRHTDSGPWSV